MSRHPELIIKSLPSDAFLEAVCSLCPKVQFMLSENTLREKRLLRELFDNHVRRAHQSEPHDMAEPKGNR
jgi:hypothetical protein